MRKLPLLLAFSALVVLVLGTTYAPNSSAFWLATGTHLFQEMRIGLCVILCIQLVTNPPRRLWFRILAGSVGACVSIWAVQLTYAGTMQLLDSLAYVGAAVSIIAAALERPFTDAVHHASTVKVKV